MKVTQCLQQADNEGMHSIAFPTFGTGNFGYPAQVSADQMFGAIRTFFQTTRHNLITVVIFLYAPDNETSQVFEKSIGSFFQPYVQPTVDIKQDKPGDNKDKALKANFKASIITTFGNLEESKTDVILDTTTNFPKLNGIIPQNLLKAAGKELQDECDAKDKVTENMVVKTKAYKLKCQNIYHFVMPQWNQAKGETIISDCIYKCLMMMKGDALTSIAVPAIGTGGAKYDPATVAKGICSAVTRFGSESPDYACVVTVVFYPGGPQEPNTIIKSIIDKWKTDRNSEAGQPKPIKGVKMVNFNMPIEDDEDEDDVTFEIPKDTREFLLLQFMSDKTENVDTAFNTIKERIDKDRKEIVVTLDNKDAVDEVALIENDKKTFEEFGRIFKVSLNIDLKQRKIIITGLGDTVMECYQKILSELRDRKKMIMSKEIGSTLQKHVEWYFTEDKGDLWVPYPRYLSYILEEAFESNVNVKEFQDSNKKTYVVDFVKGNEVEKEDKHNATVVSVIRKDYTEGIGEVFPKCWTYMAEGENLAEVVLDSSDAEYKDAEAAFLKTIVPYNLSQIKEIRRVQNRKPVPAIPNKKEAAGNGPAKCAEYRTKSLSWLRRAS
ncbi:protein mono-ADP-ribosyltransferase PARP14-like [Dreissena polymorpha]|uniref:protein mono-ADP-ribosyltransferase PARP14-like n=1 Tax=Dreissena polymorpha TaxID=45954 RepID=UPI002264060A|nr:protein mono-ADP-ribosyltransferase PARP14-like [Dreissena polymorpha]